MDEYIYINFGSIDEELKKNANNNNIYISLNLETTLTSDLSKSNLSNSSNLSDKLISNLPKKRGKKELVNKKSIKSSKKIENK